MSAASALLVAVEPVVSRRQLDVLVVAVWLGLVTVCVLIGVYAVLRMFVAMRVGGRR